MELSKLITEMQAKGFVNIKRFKLTGQSKYVADFVSIMAITEIQTDDKDWWTLRAFIIATDRDRMFAEYPLGLATRKRNN